jgi:hypothetical protein
VGDYVFLMCHVPKSAGTSVCDIFSQIYGAQNCRIQTEPEDRTFLENFQEDVEKGVRFFSGHVPMPELIHLRRAYPRIPIEIVLTLRHPVSHFYALFLHNKMPSAPFAPERK